MVQEQDDRLINRLTATSERPTNVPGFADVAVAPSQEPPDEIAKRIAERRRRNADSGLSVEPKATGFSNVANWPVLKQGLDALGAFERNVTDPLAGAFWGYTTTGLASAFGREALTKEAQGTVDNFKNNVLDSSGLAWQKLGEFNRTREEVFPLEKFLSSIVFDPTTYIGLGVYSKVPKIGTITLAGRKVEVSLGALEKGFLDATALPFRQGSKFLRSTVPTTASQKVRESALLGRQAANGVLSRLASGRRLSRVTADEVRKEFVQIIRAGDRTSRVKYASFDDVTKRVYDELYTPKPIGYNGLEFSRVRFIKHFDSLGVKTAGVGTDNIMHVQQMYADAVAGKVGARDAANQIIRTLGARPTMKNLKRVSNWLKKENTQRFQELDSIATQITPETFEQFVTSSAALNRRSSTQIGFDLWTEDLGRIRGGLLQGLNKFNTRVVQNGFQRWVARPFASSVLMTPGFVVDELAESISRQVLGQSSWGFRSQTEFLTDLAGAEDLIQPTLLRDEASNVTRIASLEGVEPTRVGLTEAANKALGAASGGTISISQNVSDKLSTFGKKWLDKANDFAISARRQYLASRSYKRIGEVLDREGAWRPMQAVIEDVPESFKFMDASLRQAVTTRAALTGRDGLMALKEELTVGAFKDKDLVAAIDNISDPLVDQRAKFLLIDWVAQGADPLRLDSVMKQVEEVAYDNLRLSADNLITQTEAVTLALESMNMADPAQAQQAYRIAATLFNDVTAIPSQLNSAVTHKIRLGNKVRGGYGTGARFNGARKQELYDNVKEQIDQLFAKHDPVMSRMADVLNQIQPGMGNRHLKKYEMLSNKWKAEREEIQALFNSGSARDQAFWDRFDEIRFRYWDNAEFHSEYQVLETEIRRDIDRAFHGGNRPEGLRRLPPVTIEAKKRLTVADVARMVGSNETAVIDTIASASIGGKNSFVAAVKNLAGDFNVTIKGNVDKKLGNFYERTVAANLKRRSRNMSGWEKTQQTMDGFLQELDTLSQAPRIGVEKKAILDEYLEKVATEWDKVDGASMKAKSRAAVSEAVIDLKQAFVNYDNLNFMDAAMATVFPFWTYEARRIPFLLQQGLQHPKAWDVFGPEGSYYTELDNGYTPPEWMFGYSFNIFGGTFFGTPRNFFNEAFTGGGSTFETIDSEVLQRSGFYAGPVQRVGLDFLFSGGDDAELGDLITPGIGIPINVMEQLPYVGGRIARLRNQVFDDKFMERRVLLELSNMGLPASEVDLKTMSPKPGLKRVSQDDIYEAFRKASYSGLVNTVTGKTKYEGDGEAQLRGDVEAFWKEKGISIQDQRLYQKKGIPLTSVVRLTPQEDAFLRELPGAEDRRYANTALLSGQRGAVIERVNEFWDEIDAQQRIANAEKEELNAAWLSGLDPRQWRDDILGINIRQSQQVNLLRGRAYDRTTNQWTKRGGNENSRYWDVPVTPVELEEYRKKYGTGAEPLRHPLDELIQEYREIQPLYDPETQTHQWNEFFKTREIFENEAVPDELRQAFFELLDDDLTDPEQELRNMQRGTLGDYWSIEDTVAARLGADEVVSSYYKAVLTGDDVEKKRIMASPRYKLWKKQSNLLKERARLTDPKLDYALRIFGFTTSFKNPTAQRWYRSDGNRPNLARIRAS